MTFLEAAGRPDFPLSNVRGAGAQLVGGFTEIDWRSTTAAFDAIYVRGGEFENTVGPVRAGDGLYAGVSLVGRPGAGAFNTAVRVLTSLPLGDGTQDGDQLEIGGPYSRGTLLFTEFSWTPHHTDNYFYANGFYANGNYRAAALDPMIPGPLARAGVLFDGPGLGSAPGALSATASNVAGGAFGHQVFSADTRRQLLLEGGVRYSTAECASTLAICEPDGVAAGLRYQVAVGRRYVLVFDAFAARDSLRDSPLGSGGGGSRIRAGGRTEIVVKF